MTTIAEQIRALEGRVPPLQKAVEAAERDVEAARQSIQQLRTHKEQLLNGPNPDCDDIARTGAALEIAERRFTEVRQRLATAQEPLFATFKRINDLRAEQDARSAEFEFSQLEQEINRAINERDRCFSAGNRQQEIIDRLVLRRSSWMAARAEGKLRPDNPGERRPAATVMPVRTSKGWIGTDERGVGVLVDPPAGQV